LFLEHIDDRLEKRDDAERALNLPVLASIPELKA
jgi:capsular polysaccharide biosynthesis protein